MTTVLMKDDLLRFRVDGGMLDIEFAMDCPLNAFLQGTLVRWMAPSGLSSSTGNILSPLLTKPSFLNRQLETAK
jgi:hypothetical protein